MKAQKTRLIPLTLKQTSQQVRLKAMIVRLKLRRLPLFRQRMPQAAIVVNAQNIRLLSKKI